MSGLTFRRYLRNAPETRTVRSARLLSATGRRVRLLAAAAAIALPLVVAPSAMAGCGFLNASPCPRPPVSNPAARTPGTPVRQVNQMNRALFGFFNNPFNGGIKATKRLGIPDAGTVPVVGDVGAKADDGSYVMYETRVDDRTIDLMIWSKGLLGAAPVRIQLPPSWGTDPARRYPMMLLLHGGSDPADYQCWSVYPQFKARLSDLDALIVMPSSGSGGHTTNYWDFGYQAGNQYQTFVSTELQQILERGYKLGDKAVVAGASAGGRSALEVAYKNPGRFAAVAAYSGLLDTQVPGIDQTIALGPAVSFQTPYQIWGEPVTNRRLWNDRNPAKNIDKLRGTKLYVTAGEGSGFLGKNKVFDPTEATVYAATKSFLGYARHGGLPVTTEIGRGIHSWPYFDTAFGRSLPMLTEALGLPLQPQPSPLPF